jgi:hypothetical protein
VVVSAGIGGVWAAGAGSPSARLVPGSPTVGPSDTPTASDPALTDSTSGTDPVQPPESSLPWSGSDGSVPLPTPPFETRVPSASTSVPPLITILPGTGGEGPVISGVQVPTVVMAGDTATFRWRANDPDTVSSTGITVGWSSGIYTACGFGQSARLESGSLADGIWVFSCTIPSSAVSTEYTVDVYAQDALGHWSNSSGHTFDVRGGSDDSSAPVVTDVMVIGSARVGQVLTTTWTLSDESGIASGVLWVAGPGGTFTDLSTGLRYVQYDTMQISRQCTASGSSCAYTQTVRIDPDSPTGAYTLWSSAIDSVGNKHLMPIASFDVVG